MRILILLSCVLSYSLSSFAQIKIDSSRVKEINDETDWQATLENYRGKVVVTWIFPANFEKEPAIKQLNALRKAQELNKGKNVVFLKCVQQRRTDDKAKHLLGYLQLTGNKGAGRNILYVHDRVSVMKLLQGATDYVIYNAGGQPHHPLTDTLKKREQEDITLTAALDSVLAGKGRYYEGMAPAFFNTGKKYGGSRDKQIWTRSDSSGIYRTYTSGIPDEPADSVTEIFFDILTFAKGNLVGIQKAVMHKVPAQKPNDFDYRPEMLKGTRIFTYEFDEKENFLRLYDRTQVLYKKYRVVVINENIMVLALPE